MNSVYRRIVVPIQGSHLDTRAIDLAIAIAGRFGGCALTLVYVAEVPQHMPLDAELSDEVTDGEEILARIAAYAQAGNDTRWQRITTELLQARSASAAIVDEAIERGADAVVLAVENHREHGIVTQGETVPYVLKNAPCDVILIRAMSEDGEI
ncbi:MAG TPA: universal stress protein [Nitrolancea sp.]|nr:universal stress protein [Nitrolancea sp.]